MGMHYITHKKGTNPSGLALYFLNMCICTDCEQEKLRKDIADYESELVWIKKFQLYV